MGILSLATKATSPTITMYLAGAILALFVSLYLVIAVQSANVSKRDATIADLRASIAETTANATQAARVAEQVAARSLAEAVETNRKANENAQAEFDAALADSAVRLRKRFACQARSPDLPSDAAAASGSDGADGAGFGAEDARVAFGIAATGDTAIRRLTLCQDTVRTCQQVCGAK